MAAPPAVAQMPFIRNLASSDKRLRTASLASLKTFLSSRRELSLDDARKLWTGLYYALWMTDRPLPQQRLAAELANLVLPPSSSASSPATDAEPAAVRPACAVPWLQAFWAVLADQWPSIDALRMDKFMLLVRLVFAAQIRLAALQKPKPYSGPLVDALLQHVLRDWCFDDGAAGAEALKRMPVGLRLHVLDIWVDELDKAGALADDDAADFVAAVGAMVDALKRCPIKPARKRAEDSHADERLPWGVPAPEDEEAAPNGMDEDSDDDGWGGIQD
jgi:ribosomal RNA-processing protein 1